MGIGKNYMLEQGRHRLEEQNEGMVVGTGMVKRGPGGEGGYMEGGGIPSPVSPAE